MANLLKSVTKMLTLKNLLIAVFAIGVAVAVYMALYGNVLEGFTDCECEEGLECNEDGECVAVDKFENDKEGEVEGVKEGAKEEGEKKDEEKETKEEFMNAQMGATVAANAAANHNVAGIGGYEEGGYASINEEDNRPEMPKPKNPASCFPRDSLNPGELLPKEQGEYSAFAPMGQGNLAGRNFLEAGKQIGVDTVGQSLRNANYQLRSEPPNPRMAVTVFNNSTIAPDNSRRQLEIGSCA